MLTLAVLTKLESWNLLFSSLEKFQFEIKKVAEFMKVEIFFYLLEEHTVHLQVHVNAEEMRDYEKVKSVILWEF